MNTYRQVHRQTVLMMSLFIFNVYFVLLFFIPLSSILILLWYSIIILILLLYSIVLSLVFAILYSLTGVAH